MDCLKKYDYITYLEGMLNPSDREDYEIHFGNCNKCKVALMQIQMAMEVIDNQKAITANPFLFTRIKEKLTAKVMVPLKIRVLRPVIVSGIAVFAMVVGITLGYVLTNIYTNGSDSNSIVWNELEQENIEMAFLQE